jgi:hypothetical protein
MYARSMLVTLPPDKWDEAVAVLRDEMGPRFEDLQGFCGFTLVGNRDRGQVFGLSYWRSADDRDRGSELGRKIRSRMEELAGEKTPAFQLWEVVYHKVSAPTLTSADVD